MGTMANQSNSCLTGQGMETSFVGVRKRLAAMGNVMHATWMLTEAPKAHLYYCDFRPRNNSSLHILEFFSN